MNRYVGSAIYRGVSRGFREGFHRGFNRGINRSLGNFWIIFWFGFVFSCGALASLSSVMFNSLNEMAQPREWGDTNRFAEKVPSTLGTRN